MKKTFALILALLVAPAAFADTGKTADTSKSTDTSKTAAKQKLSDAELQVIAHYHNVNLLEIDLGKTAKLKGATAGVKSYGAMLVKDHGDADKKLQAMVKKTAQRIPVEKPASDVEKQEMADTKTNAAKLKKLKGKDFDNGYLSMMVEGHEKELAKIDAKVADVQNTELADMLRGMKPTLQQHADQARELQKGDGQAMNMHDHSMQPSQLTTTAQAPQKLK